MKVTFSVPMLPPSLNSYIRMHWAERQRILHEWKQWMFFKWIQLDKPRFRSAQISLTFIFPDQRLRDQDNFIATGSKLVGDSIKGLFIPDDSPTYLKKWSFDFSLSNPKRTEISIEGRKR